MKTDWTVHCISCRHTWIVQGGDSIYEREAMESRPCPHCLSYTLSRIETARPARSQSKFRLPIQKFRPRVTT